MSLDKSRVTNNVISALEADPNFSSDLTSNAPATKKFIEVLFDKLIDEIIDNMVIKGVTVSTTGILDTPTPPVPVPTDGGAAILTTMVANTLTKNLTQSNDGTGRVE